jgi:hypothetical protein
MTIKLSSEFTTFLRRARATMIAVAPEALKQAVDETWVPAAQRSNAYSAPAEARRSAPSDDGDVLEYEVTGLTRRSIQSYRVGFKRLKQFAHTTRIKVYRLNKDGKLVYRRSFDHEHFTNDGQTSPDGTPQEEHPEVVITANINYLGALTRWMKDHQGVDGPVMALNKYYYRKRVMEVAGKKIAEQMAPLAKEYT